MSSQYQRLDLSARVPIPAHMILFDEKKLSLARRQLLGRMIRRAATFYDGTPARRVARLRRQASEFARDNDISEVAVFNLVVLPQHTPAPRGGWRENAGRKARHWPSVLCCVDSDGPIVGPDLFDIEFALVVRAAADPAAGDAKATFERWALEARDAQRTGTAAAWSAYRHALTRGRNCETSEDDWRKRRRAAARVRLGMDPRTGRLVQPGLAR